MRSASGGHRAAVRISIGTVPEPEAAVERIRVRAQPEPGGQLAKLLRVPSAEDDVAGLAGGAQLLDRLRDRSLPLLLPEAFEARPTDVVLVGRFAERQVAEFERLELSVVDQGRSEAG